MVTGRRTERQIHWHIYSLTHSFTHSCTHSLSHWMATESLTWLSDRLNDWLIQSYTHSLTQSLFHFEAQWKAILCIWLFSIMCTIYWMVRREHVIGGSSSYNVHVLALGSGSFKPLWFMRVFRGITYTDWKIARLKCCLCEEGCELTFHIARV